MSTYSLEAFSDNLSFKLLLELAYLNQVPAMVMHLVLLSQVSYNLEELSPPASTSLSW